MKINPQQISELIKHQPLSWRGISFTYSRSLSSEEESSTNLIIKVGTAGVVLSSDSSFTIPDAQYRINDVSKEWQIAQGFLEFLAAHDDKTSASDEAEFYSILIVEDEPMTSKLIAHQLAQYGTVSATSNAREAVANYMVHRPDIVFLDIHYGDERDDGFDVLQKLLSADAGAQIVMISGDRDPHTLVRALRSGARGFIAKPFKAEDFVHYFRGAGRLHTRAGST